MGCKFDGCDTTKKRLKVWPRPDVTGLSLLLHCLPSDIENEDWVAMAEIQERVKEDAEQRKKKNWERGVKAGWG